MDIVKFDVRFIKPNTHNTLKELPCLEIFMGKESRIIIQFKKQLLGTPYAAQYNYLDGELPPERTTYVAPLDGTFWHQVETATYISFD